MRRKISKFTLICVLVIGLASCISDGEPSLFPQPTSTTTVDILSPDYMSGCYLLNPTHIKEQIGFQGIYPGKTGEREVLDTFGTPNSIFTTPYGTDLYSYDRFEIAIENQTVTVVGDKTQGYLFRNMVSEYGCPDFILTGINPEMTPLTVVVYLKQGIYMDIFNEYPFTLESNVYLTYFEPTTMDEFLKSEFVMYIGNIRIVSWDEAIR